MAKVIKGVFPEKTNNEEKKETKKLLLYPKEYTFGKNFYHSPWEKWGIIKKKYIPNYKTSDSSLLPYGTKKFQQ